MALLKKDKDINFDKVTALTLLLILRSPFLRLFNLFSALNDLQNLRQQPPMPKPDAANPRQLDAVVTQSLILKLALLFTVLL